MNGMELYILKKFILQPTLFLFIYLSRRLRGITAQDFLSLDFFCIIIIDILTIELVFELNISFYKLCKDTFCSITKTDGQWPNEPKTMNLLESGLEIECSMSQEDTDHNRLVISGMNKTSNLSKKSYPWSSPRKICSYIFLLDLYRNYSSLLHSHVSLLFLMIPFVREFIPLYFFSFFHLNPPSVDQITNLLNTCLISTFLKFFGGSCKTESYCSGITSTLIRSGGQMQSIQCSGSSFLL